MNSERIEALYDEYIETAGARQDGLHATWRKISADLDRKLAAGTLTTMDLARYEEAVSCAAFHAGYTAAVEEAQ